MRNLVYNIVSKNRSGATAIEAALCLPLILVLFFACFQYGFFFYNTFNMNRILDNATRGVLLMDDQSEGAIVTYLNGQIPDELRESVTLEAEVVSRFDGEFAKISMEYTYTFDIPFADKKSLNSHYRNFIILSADIDEDDDDEED